MQAASVALIGAWGIGLVLVLPPRSRIVTPAWVVGGLALFIACQYAMSRMPCPRCGHILGYRFILLAGRLSQGGTRHVACPACGIKIDDPLP